MALIDPSLSSYPRRQWVDEISDILKHQLEIEVETPPPVVSIFKVPETMTTQKPEAFEPQQTGLGPYHHLRPLPYKKMEQKKLAAMRRVLKDDHKFKDFKLCVLDKVRKLVPIVRDCYNMFLESDEDSLSWVFAIDGIFLLDLFRSYDTGMGHEKNADQLPLSSEIQPCIAHIPHKTASDESVTPIYHVIEDVETLQPLSTKVEIDEAPCTSSLQQRPEIRLLAQENQTVEVKECPPSQLKHPKVDPNNILIAQDITMVENQIPFTVLKEIDDALHLSSAGNKLSPSVYRTFSDFHSPLELCSLSEAPTHVEHLLDYMYHSIVYNFSSKTSVVLVAEDSRSVIVRWFSNIRTFFSFRLYRKSSPIDSIPKDEIVKAYKQTVTFLENFTRNTTTTPSASKLHDRAKFSSDITLRNLIAYEILMNNSAKLPLTEYIGLIAQLIVNVDDVELLQNENIIKGDLSEAEVVKLFTGMRTSITSMNLKEKKELQENIKEVKKLGRSFVEDCSVYG
nr:hypothetical protein [Tanacetum cinerariifolium]